MLLMPWEVDEYHETFRHIVEIINDLDPAVVVVDSVFSPGMDAVRQLNRLHAIVNPNALSDWLSVTQPYGAMLWKYPA